MLNWPVEKVINKQGQSQSKIPRNLLLRENIIKKNRPFFKRLGSFSKQQPFVPEDSFIFFGAPQARDFSRRPANNHYCTLSLTRVN